MSSFRALGRQFYRLPRHTPKKQNYGRQPHDRTVTRGILIGRTAIGLACLFKPLQRSSNRCTDVETPPRAAQVPLPEPARIPSELVYRIETTLLYKAFGKAQRH